MPVEKITSVQNAGIKRVVRLRGDEHTQIGRVAVG